jgi:NAD(P)-dependent dehydrogenase (short-subunit alcohol dehydrogenase family)
MFTYQLARRLDGAGVTATAAHPGVVATSFGAEDPAAHLAIMIGIAPPFMKTPAQGPLTPNKAYYDTAAAVRLWQASAALTGLTSNRRNATGLPGDRTA